jgi:beta-phosphoglucomutase-like phosphatase (HAD superfamily)
MKENKIIVDLDGTLIDTKKANKLAYEHAFKELLNIKFNYDDFYGKSFDFIADTLKLTDKQKIDIKNYKKKIYASYFNEASVNENLISKLKELKKDYELVLYTMASKENAINILNYFNLYSLFDIIITVEDLPYRKPDLNGFKCILNDCKNHIIYEDDILTIQKLKENNFNVISISF